MTTTTTTKAITMTVMTVVMMATGTAASAPLGSLASVAYPVVPRDDAIEVHDRDTQFLVSVMLRDQLWMPILCYRVNMTAPPRTPTDHFVAAQPAATAAVVDPFREVVLLMTSNSMAGKEVRYAADAVRGAMLCSALQHVSLQAFLLHHLIARGDGSASAAAAVVRLLEHMLRVAIDKLVAADRPAPLISRMHYHVRKLMTAPADAKMSPNQLRAIGQEMLDDMGRRCASPAKGGPYARLISAFNSPATAERLGMIDDTIMMDETLKGVEDLASIQEIQQMNGKLEVSYDVDVDGLGTLDEIVQKKLAIINRIEMNFLWANLPIKAMADAQWADLFNVERFKTL